MSSFPPSSSCPQFYRKKLYCRRVNIHIQLTSFLMANLHPILKISRFEVRGWDFVDVSSVLPLSILDTCMMRLHCSFLYFSYQIFPFLAVHSD